MDRSELIVQLEAHAVIFQGLFRCFEGDAARWRPAPDKWCALEIACHLRDEEVDDFRIRTDHVLRTPNAPLPPTDPPAWMVDRRYMEQNIVEVVAALMLERQRSISWLRSQEAAPWTNVHQHPRVGPISAGLFLENWVAHDLHHMRQLVSLRYAYLRSKAEHPLDYAGKW